MRAFILLALLIPSHCHAAERPLIQKVYSYQAGDWSITTSPGAGTQSVEINQTGTNCKYWDNIGGHSIADDASVGVSSGMPATSTYPVRGEGLLITTSNTGTAQLRFRSETTAVTTAKAGMTLVVEKVA